MVIFGIDPSFKRTGVTIIKSRSIEIVKVEHEVLEKDFLSTALLCDSIHKDIRSLLEPYKSEEIHLVSEYPPPFSQYSAGLYALDVHFVLALKNDTRLKKLNLSVVPPIICAIYMGLGRSQIL